MELREWEVAPDFGGAEDPAGGSVLQVVSRWQRFRCRIERQEMSCLTNILIPSANLHLQRGPEPMGISARRSREAGTR